MFWNSLFVKFLGSNSWPGTVFNMFVIIGFLMKESLPAKQWAVLLLSMKEIPPVPLISIELFNHSGLERDC